MFTQLFQLRPVFLRDFILMNRGLAMAILFVCVYVRLGVCLSVTLVIHA